MMYFLLGLALGTFVSGLIAKYYDKQSNWISPVYLFSLSGLLVLFALFLG